MKHDPMYPEPELWVLRSVGSFSFEFMGGGRAVICGWDCGQGVSVLGDRACVGHGRAAWSMFAATLENTRAATRSFRSWTPPTSPISTAGWTTS